jgi:hypothetical protein
MDYQLENQGVDGMIILKFIVQKYGVDWIHVA